MSLRRTIRRMLRRAFEAAGGGPRSLTSAWATNADPVRAQLAARHQLAARGNYQVNNSPAAAAIADVWVTSLVGDGPSVRSGHPDEEVRAALEDTWSRFYEQADAEGTHDLAGLISSATRSLVINGEALLVHATTPRGEPRVRLLSVEQLDPSITREVTGSARIICGVEFNVAGERVAYHILPEHPEWAIPILWEPVRVAADDVMHLFVTTTPGQVRGVSWLSSVLTRLQELDRLDDALLARANVSALFGGFVQSVDGSNPFPDADLGDPNELSIEPGAMRLLPPGCTVQFPDIPDAGNTDALIKHLLRSIASGVGVPYELLTGDLSQVNYSSAKLGLEAFKRRVASLRASLLDARLLRPLWRRVVLLEILSGRLQAPDFERDPEPFFRMTAMWPGFAPLDPYREAESDVLLLNAGLRSRAEIIAARGRDIADVDAEFAADGFVPRVPARQSNPALLGGSNA